MSRSPHAARVVVLLAACGTAAFSLATSLPACDDTYVPPVTSDYGLADITVSCEAESNGEALIVRASLGVPHDQGAAYDDAAELGTGDALMVRAGTEARELTAFEHVSISHHAALLRSPAVDIELALERGAERARAIITLPSPFVLNAPAGPVAADAPIDLAWDAATAGEEVTVVAFGPCLTLPFNRRLEQDTGTYAIQPSDLAFDDASVPCELSVSVARVATSAGIGPRGTCTAAQIRTARVEVAR